MAQGERFELFLKNTFPTATYFTGWSHISGKSSKNFGVKFEKLKTKDLNYDLVHQLGSTIIFSQQIVKLFRKQKFNILRIFLVLPVVLLIPPCSLK